MKKIQENIRIIILVIVILLTFVFSSIRLMKIQIVDGEKYYLQSQKKVSGTINVVAPRGQIVDSKGVPIVTNKVGYSVVIEYAFFPSDKQEQNEILLKLANIIEDGGDEINESIPITQSAPYEFTTEDSNTSKMKSKLRLAEYATADNCIEKLIELYEISDEYTQSEQRKIAGIRYEMLLNEFSVNNSYEFAEEIKEENVAKIKELSYEMKGIDVIEKPIRIYAQSDVFPHGIGTVGPIYAEEYQELKDQGYMLNDTLGKSGIEKIMESELRGTNGKDSIVIDSANDNVTVNEEEPVVPGNTVKLTIDSEYQKKVQNILEDTIKKLNSQTDPDADGKYAKAGSIVVLNAKTGAVLAMATYPTYNIEDYINNYSEVLARENAPLLNRCINGLYRPGSTFKPITATAALNEGVINKDTHFTCQRDYEYLDQVMHCTGAHGSINIITAIEKSCNIFFYNTAQYLGITKLLEYEHAMGLGVDLNFELDTNTGYLACPESFAKLGIPWYPGELLQAAIGQSQVAVTPLAMAVEALTVANNGVRYRPYIVDSIWSYNQDELIKKTEPIIDSKIEDKTGETFSLVKQGMVLVAKNTNGNALFPYDKYTLNTLPEDCAIKTGTPQVTKELVNSCLVGMYPAEDPEIVFSIVIENGQYAKYVARPIIDAYYGWDEISAEENDDNNEQGSENVQNDQ